MTHNITTTATEYLENPLPDHPYPAVSVSSVSVTVTDADEPGILLSRNTISLNEGTGDTYGVNLQTEPTEEATVTITGHADTPLTPDKTTLIFTISNWETEQSVRVTAADDEDAVVPEDITLTHTAAGGDYGSETADLTVKVLETDTAGVTITPDELAMVENESKTYSVVLTSRPLENVDVDIAVPGGAEITTENQDNQPVSSLTFTPENWDTPQEVTVNALDDTDAVDEPKVVIGHATDTEDGLYAALDDLTGVAVTVTDDDERETATTVGCTADAIWCATLQLADYSVEDWGLFSLEHNPHNPGPPSSLSDDEFMYRSSRHGISDIEVRPGVFPSVIPRAPFATHVYPRFFIEVWRGQWEIYEAPREKDYRGWTLYVDDIELRFSEAYWISGRIFMWQDSAFDDLFHSWTPSTTYQLRIEETPLSEQAAPEEAPGAPLHLRATPRTRGELRLEWNEPASDGRSEITGYLVQWKELQDNWGTPSEVSEATVPRRISPATHYRIRRLKVGVDYAVRVSTINGTGAGPYSDEAHATTQADSGPWMVETVVDGDALTLAFDRDLDENSVPAATDFLVLVHGELITPESVLVSGGQVILTLSDPVVHIDEVHVLYVSQREFRSPGIRDRDGNYHVSTSSYKEVGNDTEVASLPQLTASFENTPDSHNGVDGFTFNVAFSESVWIRPYPAAAMVEVTSGSITSAGPVDRRTEMWELTAVPDSDAPVEITLSAEQSCSAWIPCANGERRLSNTVRLVVPFLRSQSQSGNSPATGAPAINGTPRVRESITVDTRGIDDEDGLTTAVFAYQWIRNNWTSFTEIAGATGPSYTLVPADEGRAIKVRVTFDDDAGNPESLTSAAVANNSSREELPQRPRNLTGMANEDGSVTLIWDDPDDETITGYQVLRRRPTAGENTLLVYMEHTSSAATTYTDANASADIRHAYRVKAINMAGLSKRSNYVNVTPPAPREPTQNTPATGQPAISGTARVGEMLTAETSAIEDEDGLNDANFSYQWLADESDTPSATNSTYTLAADDQGKSIKVRVSFTDDAGNEETLTSEATNPVAGLPPEPLTARFENQPSSHDGENVFTFELRFSEQFNLSYKTLRDHAFTVTGGTVKKAKRMEQGSNIHWRITVRPDSNSEVSIVLPVTTDCDGQGAICTADGRELANRNELTVSGPGG